MTPPRNVSPFSSQQADSVSTGSQTTQKTASEKAAELLSGYFEGLLRAPAQVIDESIDELKKEGSAIFNAFMAYKDGNKDGCKQILLAEFDREMLPFKNMYHRIKNKFK